MRSGIVIAIVMLVGSSVARADRGPVLGLTLGGALVGDTQAPDRLDSLVGASLAWQKSVPELPAVGTAVGQVQLVPELGLVVLGQRGGALAGVRLQADFAQHGMGVFHVSARMSMWLEPQVGVLRDADGPLLGGDFGEMFLVGRGDWQVGGVMGIYTWREPGASTPVPVAGTIDFAPGAPGTRQIAATFALVVAR
jgi:hypothetical protein